MPTYSKPFLDFDEQLQLMIDRGLAVADHQAARDQLIHLGYYRLSRYLIKWHDESSPDGRWYKPGRSFENAIALYSFDRRLRLHLLDAIERIEVALKIRVANTVGNHGPLVYLKQSSLHGSSYHFRKNASENNFQYLCRRNRELFDDSSEEFARELRKKGIEDLPVWIAVELWDFGLLRHFYDIMSMDDRLEVSLAFNVPAQDMLNNWLGCINQVRNICAHHGRLYNRHLTQFVGSRKAKRLPDLRHLFDLSLRPDKRQYMLYPALAAIVFLMQAAAPGSSWRDELVLLLEKFPDMTDASLADYGFPDSWKSESLWN